MCFSAQASFTAAAGLAIIGFLAIYKAHTNTLRLFACTPLFFALQQALEGIVWLNLMNNNTSTMLHTIATYGFVFFAGIFWPVCIPSILYALETDTLRKKILLSTIASGSCVASISAYIIIMFGPVARIAEHHIAYDQNWHHTPLVLLCLYSMYTFAVIVPFFVSSIQTMWLVGLALAIGFVVASISFWLSSGSVWCFFAALISALVYKIVMQENKKHSTQKSAH
ncbi:MAG: hypothetical protein NTX86_04890 [Candidatus Dependentiae bacterium]|nr:hypothetical protein [Candidatus Dependentiae bacterium]